MAVDTDPHAQVEAAIREHRPIEAQYVRQGKRNMRLVWVLIISLAAAALATFGMWTLRSGDLASTEPHPRAEAADAQSFSPGDPVAKQDTSQDPSAASRGSTDTAQHPDAR
jgi:hypothetical protein